jgi:hypothetical protein
MAERQYENRVLHRNMPLKRSITSSAKLDDQLTQFGIVIEWAPTSGVVSNIRK